MKTLYLCRHAHAETNVFLPDHERELTEEGINACKQISSIWMSKEEPMPETWVSSSSKRALKTARMIAAATENPATVLVSPSIYEATRIEVLRFINSLSDQSDSAIIFGHNPAISEIINYLTGRELAPVSPATLTKIIFDLDCWKLISGNTGILVWSETP